MSRYQFSSEDISASQEWELNESQMAAAIVKESEGLLALQKKFEQKEAEMKDIQQQLTDLKVKSVKPKKSFLSCESDDDTASPMKHSTPELKVRSEATTRTHRREVIPEKYNGKTGWDTYVLHFEACKNLNSWSETEAASWLAASLTGEAVLALGNDVTRESKYTDLKKQLSLHFGPSANTDQYTIEFRHRRRRTNESLPELAQALRRLAARAYPDMPLASRNQLTVEQFKDAVDGELRAAIFRAKPTSLESAVSAAVEMEGYLKAEKARRSRVGVSGIAYGLDYCSEPAEPREDSRLGQLEKRMEEMMEMMGNLRESLSTPKSESRPQKKGNSKSCFYCKEEGHFKTSCQKFKDENPEGFQRYLEQKGKALNEKRLTQGAMGRPDLQ